MEFDDEIVEETKALAYSQGAGIQQRVVDMILSKPDKLLLQALETRSRRPSAGQAVVEYARGLFLALGPSARRSDSTRSSSILLHISVRIIEIVQRTADSADRKLLDCINIVIQEIDALPQKCLPFLVEPIIQNFGVIDADAQHGASLQLLPRCLSVIASSSHQVELPYGTDGNSRYVSGTDYVDDALKRILSFSPWPKPLLVKITGMLREMPLSESLLVEFLNSIFTQMEQVDPVDLPALTYQLLLLASKRSKRTILTGILSFFSRLSSFLTDNTKRKGAYGNKFSSESFRQIEGTVVLHINFAVKQNPALGQEILFLIRCRYLLLSPFVLSVILSVARIQRFEEPALNLLKTVVVRSFQDSKLGRYSISAPLSLKTQCFEEVQSLEQSFMQTVRNTAFGWDHVVPSLVNFGFILIEASATGESPFSDYYIKPQQAPCPKELGAVILKTAFEVHEMARDEIIEQSKCRIMALKPEQSSPIIKMVGQLVQNYPHLMLEHIPRLKECLDYYTFLHPIASSAFIHYICPLFHLSADLQGYTVLVLRKAMFGREILARMTALQGLIELVVAECTSRAQNDLDSMLNSSEASCSQQERPYQRKNSHLIYEVKGLFRRCLLQQAKIREALYAGLIKLVLVDPSSADIAFNLLWPHFCKYYKTAEDKDTSLDVSSCVKSQNCHVVVEEPLEHLVFCIHSLLTLQPPEDDADRTLTENYFEFSLSQDQEMARFSAAYSLRDAFLNIRKQLKHRSLLSDLGLDKSQNFAVDTAEGRLNLEKVHIYMGIYEVMIDAVVTQLRKGTSPEEGETELQLHISMYDELEQIFQKHCSGSLNKLRALETLNTSGKPPSGSPPVVEPRIPFLSVSNTSFLLGYVTEFDCSGMSPNNNDSTSQSTRQSTAKEDQIILKYKVASLTVRTCLRHLRSSTCTNIHQDEGFRGVGGDWRSLGKSVVDALAAAVTAPSSVFTLSFEKKEKEKQVRGRKSNDEAREGLILLLVKCIDEIFRLALQKNCVMDILEHILHGIAEEVLLDKGKLHEKSLRSEQAAVHHFLIKKIQPILEHLLHRSRFREFEVLSGVTFLLGTTLEPSQINVHALWAQSFSKTMKLTHNGAVTALFRLSVCILAPPEDLILTQCLSEELLTVVGTDEDEGTEISEIYKFINTSTKNCIAGLILQHLDSTLSDIEWFISKLKLNPTVKSTDLAMNSQPQFHAESSRLKLEAALHTRLEALVLVLSTFVQMSASGAVAEQFLKVSAKLYKCLAAATKVCVAPKGFKQALPTVKFQQLVEVTCRKLTAPLYNFMAITQRDQQENCQAKGSVNKIKREVKTIPNLVFHIEDYERYLIQLGKLTKVNLLRHAKRSTARDFKILDTGKKGKQRGSNNPRDEAVEAAAESPNSEREEHTEQEHDEQHEPQEEDDGEKSSEDEEDQGSAVKLRRPMEKRVRKSAVQDSDEDPDNQATKKQRGT